MKHFTIIGVALATFFTFGSTLYTPLHAQPRSVDAELEAKVEKTLSQMTLQEKVRLSYAQSKFSSPGVARLGVPELSMSDGPHGVRMEILWDSWDHAEWTNDSCTAFPALTCLAATWNPEMGSLYGRMVGEEARYRKKSVLLGPGVNLYRSPLNGRNFEYMGEDPYLASQMCVPYIQGLQSNGVACCVKHYALNEQEVFRGHVDVRVSDRALYELYLRPFQAAVQQGGAWSLMGSYNQYLDQHASHNQRLLNEILKKEWGFDGAVISDWGATHNTREAALYGLDLEMGSYTNGLTSEAQINSYDQYYLGKRYLDMCLKGEIPEDVINDKARRMLRLLYRTELNPNRGFGSMNSPEHTSAGRKIAQEGIVLLKNNVPVQKGAPLLPINAKAYKKILVVGENATRSLCEGGGSSELKARDEVSPLRGIQERFGKDCEVLYAKGYESGPAMYGRINEISAETYAQMRAEAVEQAKQADLVIYVGGLNKNHFQDCEGGDRLSYNLPFHQDELISELLKVNKNIVLVIVSGNAYDMPWLNEAPALVQSWYLGSEAGHALADVLSGDVNFSGKLPFTMAQQLIDYPAHQLGRVAYPGVLPNELPATYASEAGKPLSSAQLLSIVTSDKKGQALINTSKSFPESIMQPNNGRFGGRGTETEVYAEDILLGYRWFDYFGQNGTSGANSSKGSKGSKGSACRVRFPFGYGLSYTTFAYGKPTISGRTVSVKVKNTGSVEGQEVVQFYVGDDQSSVIRPVKELKHFSKIALQPGEEREVTYEVQDDDLKFFDEQAHQWRSEAGTFTIYVGASSADIKGVVSLNVDR